MTPQKLGKYELHESLGRGGFGTVYRATDTALGREVAVKVLHPQLMVDPGFVERFRNEARLIAGLEHPNLVTVYDLGEAEGRAFLVMRYLPGGSLRERLQNGPLPFDTALQILRQISAGLEAAHAKGIIHRDIKPENILFTEDGQAVLSDFGLAKAVLDSTSSGSSSSGGVGTPSYRAPELWRGKPPASPATDQYALACVFTEMLTGQRLFAGETPDEIITKHLVDGPVFPAQWPSDAPRGLEKVIAKALEKDPGKRYASLGEFVGALDGLLRPRLMAELKPKSAAISQPKSVAPISSDRSTNWWKLAAIGLFVISALVIGSILLSARGTTTAPEPTSSPTDFSLQTSTIRPSQTPTPKPGTLTPTLAFTATNTPNPTATSLGVWSGKIIFASEKDGNSDIYAVNADGSKLVNLTNNKAYDNFLSFVANANKILFSSDRDGTIDLYIMNVDGSNPINLTNNSADYWNSDQWAYHPINDRIIVTSRQENKIKLFVIGINGSKIADLAEAHSYEIYEAFWSPDSNKIFLYLYSVATGSREYYIVNADGTDLIKMSGFDTRDNYFLGWSPDSKMILFDQVIYRVNKDSVDLINLTDHMRRDFFSSWSPDGSKIVFTTYRDGNSQIYLRNADGSNPINISRNKRNDYGPAWSPDGTKIVFHYGVGEHQEIYIMNADGSNQVNLTNRSGSDYFVAWSVDGAKIIFAGSPQGTGIDRDDIFIMNADGSNQIQLTNSVIKGGYFNIFMDWSPDGTKIIVSERRDGHDDELLVIDIDGNNQINLGKFRGSAFWIP